MEWLNIRKNLMNKKYDTSTKAKHNSIKNTDIKLII